MIAYLVRFIKRVGLLLPGLAIAYFALRKLYPQIERHSSVEIAVLFTYVITAYILIPFSIRLIRIIFKTSHLPLYCTTPDGFASDPVNIAVIGTRNELINAMMKAGWYQADRRTVRSLVRMALSIAFSHPYHHAPFSSLYMFGRSQDIGFQKPLDSNPLHRHHVRFWAATYRVEPSYRDHVVFWRRHHASGPPTRVFWVGAASLDTGFGLIRHNAQITHMIHPDTNAERELIIRDLRKARRLAKVRHITVGKPYQLRNRVWRGILKSDGKMSICELK